ncbi:MAG: exonuclease SbcCD subunit D [Enterococcus sp.]
MRFLHTADWHIGKKLQGYDLLEDQRKVLEDVLQIAKEEVVDAIVIAGDLYDRGVPPVDAVQMFNEQMVQWNLKEGFPILAISGNHDSSTRVSVGTSWFKHSAFFLNTQLKEAFEPITIKDVQFFLLPYFEPVAARLYFDDDSIRTIDQAIVPVLEKMREKFDSTKKQVLVSHFFVSGSTRSDSETKIEVGGLDGIPGELLNDFDYVALGHLHNKNALQQENARYSGSLLKYSLSEINQTKGVWIIDTEEQRREFREVAPLHELIEVTASFDELLQPEFIKTIDKEAYLQVYLTDRAIIPNMMSHLRRIYPRILGIQRINGREIRDVKQKQTKQIRNPQTMATDFFSVMTGEPLTNNQQNWLDQALQEAIERD